MSEADSLEVRLVRRLCALRAESGYTLEELAERTGISRATLSRLERGESSPTASMLGALCAAFKTPLSRVIADAEQVGPSLIRAGEQVVWCDPATGFQRRLISPPAHSLKIDIIEGSLPAGAEIRYAHSPLPGLEHHLWLLSGHLSLEIEGTTFDLKPGDCLRYQLFGASCFRCPGPETARYIIAMARP